MLRKKTLLVCILRQKGTDILGSVSARLFQLKQLRVTFQARTRFKPWHDVFFIHTGPEEALAQKIHRSSHRSSGTHDAPGIWIIKQKI